MAQRLSFTLLSVALATSLSAQTPWIHVEVDEVGQDDTHVRVNLPLSVIEIAAEAAPEKILSHGRLDLAHLDKDIEVEDVRRMWAEVRDAGDAELVSVESDDETVEIRREGDQVVVEVDEAEGGDKVRIHIAVTGGRRPLVGRRGRARCPGSHRGAEKEHAW